MTVLYSSRESLPRWNGGQCHSSGQRGGAGRIQFWFGVRGILEKTLGRGPAHWAR
jgi:hypothetical protein